MGGERMMGIYNKYLVTRNDQTDRPGEKHNKCRYFVLDLNHDQYAKPALLAYAKVCRETHPALAVDLQTICRSSRFSGGRTGQGVRCVGAKMGNNLARCGNTYRGQKGWDYVGVRPFDGWVCPHCRERFLRIFNQPGLPKPILSGKLKKRHNFKAEAKRCAKAFGSTKSMDGRFPI